MSYGIFYRYCREQGWGPSSEKSILEEYIENQGDEDGFRDFLEQAKASNPDSPDWSDETYVDLMLEYIMNQDSPEAFEDFLSQKASIENSAPGFSR